MSKRRRCCYRGCVTQQRERKPRGRLRRLPWYAWIFIVPWFAWLVSILLHPIRGGTELPAPMWTEADLVPVPPEVVAALGPASDESVLRRFLDWHRSLGQSAESALEEDPLTAARVLAELFSTSVAAANSAQSLTMYRLCVSLAEDDLQSMAQLAEGLPDREDSEVGGLLSVALRDAPALSVENALVGEYVSSFRWLDSMLKEIGWQLLLITDLAATVAHLDEAFRSESPRDVCAILEGIMPSPLASLFTYNIGGKNFLSSLELTFCTLLPRAEEATSLVSRERQALREALESGF